MFTAGLILSFSLCLDLGIVNVYLIKKGLERGLWPSFLAGLGSSIGDIAYAGLSIAGIGLLLSFEPFRMVLWIGGTLTLIFLSVKMIIKAFQSNLPDSQKRSSSALGGEFVTGLILALTSPTSVLWFVTIGGGFIATANLSQEADIVNFLGGFFTASVLWSLFLAASTHLTGKSFGSRLIKLFSMASAALFAYFAFRIFMDGYRLFIA